MDTPADTARSNWTGLAVVRHGAASTRGAAGAMLVMATCEIDPILIDHA
jgi:hypothetical protein